MCGSHVLCWWELNVDIMSTQCIAQMYYIDMVSTQCVAHMHCQWEHSVDIMFTKCVSHMYYVDLYTVLI